MKQSISFFLIVFAAGITSGCSSDLQQKKLLDTSDKALFTINVQGKLIDEVPIYHQPRGSEKVYILNSRSGNCYVLHTGKGTMSYVCSVPPIPEEAEFVGLTVDEQTKKLRLHFTDATVTYSMSGRYVSTYKYSGISDKGYIYPRDGSFLPIHKNGKIFLSFIPRMENGSRNPRYYSSPVEASIDPVSGRIRPLEQSFPENYKANYYPLGNQPARMEIAKNIHAYSFFQNDSVYIRNLETGDLEVKFFGSRQEKEFQYVPYKQIKKVNAGAFGDVGLTNPNYQDPCNLPLAGHFLRYYTIPPKKGQSGFKQYWVLFDRDFQYLGETLCGEMPGWPIDSKQGILTMLYMDGTLHIRKLSW